MKQFITISRAKRSFIITGLASLLLGLVCSEQAWADDWKAAKGPLMTRWGKAVTPENAHREYPRPQLVRPRWMNLNGIWQLDIGSTEAKLPSEAKFDEKILVPFPIESALSGVMKRTERAWYHRTFSVPKSWDGDRVILHFEAIDWEAEVFVNGKRVGLHRGGYDPFSFDITGALNDGGEQELAVRVFDPSSSGSQPRGKQINKPHGIYYTPSTGIWRTVWIEPVPEAHIGRLLIEPDVDGQCLKLKVEGKGTENGGYKVEAIAAEGGRKIPSVDGKVDAEMRLPIPKDKMKLWSPDSPTLYDLKVKLTKDGKNVDEVDSYFAMRKISLGKDAKGRTCMLVNGKPIFQVGTLDQGFWPDGLNAPPSDEAMRYDLEVTKRLGFNMVRKHVKVEPRRWYYWCDKLGLLVWQDMPSGDNKTPESKKQFERELLRMVEGLRNHPSIIVWVPFNEGWGQHDTAHYVDLLKKTDPSRLVNNASGWTDKKVGDIHDIHKY
ncbi:MAG: glycoside hydrolase family 2, partial [Pirellulales bacterium]|nr:glycoside hydrolase family 2 [Pirellulales bacterium]